ncbi:hypothetical protein EVAR_32148_1 [Eumeta japonica]|uniref:Uncharacterized protein n=1 Tax=Eumeta variegata TaxID=151549 RepID=A0A4C1Z5W5_EUMVA|nr:hypothetical protein EVAR_32148_1 [Eumeta japonica]
MFKRSTSVTECFTLIINGMVRSVTFFQVASSDQNRVVLIQVDRSLDRRYQCELSAEAPLFHNDIKAAVMGVVGKPYKQDTPDLHMFKVVSFSVNTLP